MITYTVPRVPTFGPPLADQLSGNYPMLPLGKARLQQMEPFGNANEAQKALYATIYEETIAAVEGTMTVQEIADVLGIEPRTADSRLRKICIGGELIRTHVPRKHPNQPPRLVAYRRPE